MDAAKTNLFVMKKWAEDKFEYDQYLLNTNDHIFLTFEKYFQNKKQKQYSSPINYEDINEAIDKYVDEFDVISNKYIKKMTDFEDNELKLWKIILKEIY